MSSNRRIRTLDHRPSVSFVVAAVWAGGERGTRGRQGGGGYVNPDMIQMLIIDVVRLECIYSDTAAGI